MSRTVRAPSTLLPKRPGPTPGLGPARLCLSGLESGDPECTPLLSFWIPSDRVAVGGAAKGRESAGLRWRAPRHWRLGFHGRGPIPTPKPHALPAPGVRHANIPGPSRMLERGKMERPETSSGCVTTGAEN